MSQGILGIDGYSKPLGQDQIDVSGTPAVGINSTTLAVLGAVPDNVQYVLIQADAANIRWRDDGVAPTAAIGMLLAAGDTLRFTGKISDFKMIKVSGSPKANVAFYGKS